jgi:hypothetical protein
VKVTKEVRKIKGASFKAAKGLVTAKVQPKDEKANGVNGEEAGGEKKKGIVIMMGVAKKKPELHIKKPEVRICYPFFYKTFSLQFKSGSSVLWIQFLFWSKNVGNV